MYGKYSSLRGFTLVELMIVIAIIGILAAALFPMILNNYFERVRDAGVQTQIKSLATHIETTLNDYGGTYPGIAIDSQWYCVPLLSGTGGCSGIAILPGIEAYLKGVDDFNASKTDTYRNPLFGYWTNGGLQAAFPGLPGDGGYILHWTLPGRSGYVGGDTSINSGIDFLDSEFDRARNRCRPGKLFWIGHIGLDETACYLQISF